jgi:uncharacterized protein YjdB
MPICVLALGFLSACETGKVSKVSVTGVSLDRHTLSMTVGSASETLVATMTPAGATNQSVIWSSSATAVATVTPTGVVTPIGEGTAMITVTTVEGGFTDRCTVSVGAPVAVTGVLLDKTNLSLAVGWVPETLVATVTPSNATNKNVSWWSSDASVATVTQDGVVSPRAIGTTSVEVITEDGNFSKACQVSVGERVAVTGVSLDRRNLSLIVGSAAPLLVATVEPSSATNRNLIWSSSNASVATVNQSGQVSARGAGVATITVTTEDGGFISTCKVTATETVGWLMSYFGPEQDLEADSLHLAYSTDGLHWTAINDGASYYRVDGIGKNQIRDPFILRKVDGTFVLLATDWTRDDKPDYWSNPSPYSLLLAHSAAAVKAKRRKTTANITAMALQAVEETPQLP